MTPFEAYALRSGDAVRINNRAHPLYGRTRVLRFVETQRPTLPGPLLLNVKTEDGEFLTLSVADLDLVRKADAPAAGDAQIRRSQMDVGERAIEHSRIAFEKGFLAGYLAATDHITQELISGRRAPTVLHVIQAAGAAAWQSAQEDVIAACTNAWVNPDQPRPGA